MNILVRVGVRHKARLKCGWAKVEARREHVMEELIELIFIAFHDFIEACWSLFTEINTEHAANRLRAEFHI